MLSGRHHHSGLCHFLGDFGKGHFSPIAWLCSQCIMISRNPSGAFWSILIKLFRLPCYGQRLVSGESIELYCSDEHLPPAYGEAVGKISSCSFPPKAHRRCGRSQCSMSFLFPAMYSWSTTEIASA